MVGPTADTTFPPPRTRRVRTASAKATAVWPKRAQRRKGHRRPVAGTRSARSGRAQAPRVRLRRGHDDASTRTQYRRLHCRGAARGEYVTPESIFIEQLRDDRADHRRAARIH